LIFTVRWNCFSNLSAPSDNGASYGLMFRF
jgi:hypothetical protein